VVLGHAFDEQDFGGCFRPMFGAQALAELVEILARFAGLDYKGFGGQSKAPGKEIEKAGDAFERFRPSKNQYTGPVQAAWC